MRKTVRVRLICVTAFDVAPRFRLAPSCRISSSLQPLFHLQLISLKGK